MPNGVNWPGWDVISCIGKGGFGAVYEIRREVFGDEERCALKVITIPKDNSEIEYMRCEGMDDDSITNTLHSQVGDIVNEYKLMARMRQNPNIVHCDDFRYTRHENDLGWDIFIKMELLTPLLKVLDQLKEEKEIVRLGIELCNALAACQKHNIIHRDIKPQNIFTSPEGKYKLGDFGIARTMEHTTMATAGVGTHSFMAPEVAKGEQYDQTVDIYSLGLVLYWLLNERRGPFIPLPPKTPTYADNDRARTRRFMGEEIPLPKNGSVELMHVVLKACAFHPEDRYQTAQEMMDALNHIYQIFNANKVDETVMEENPDELLNKQALSGLHILSDSVTSQAYVDESIVRCNTQYYEEQITVLERQIPQSKGSRYTKHNTPRKKSAKIQEHMQLGKVISWSLIIIGWVAATFIGGTIARIKNSQIPNPNKGNMMGEVSTLENSSSQKIWGESDKTKQTMVDAVLPSEGISEETILVEAEQDKQVISSVDSNKVIGVSADLLHLAAVYEDGTVDVVNLSEEVRRAHSGYPYWNADEIKGWTGVKVLYVDYTHIVGLKTDGTVVASYGDRTLNYGQCNTSEWVDIVDIATDGMVTVGLKNDGTVVYASDNENVKSRLGNVSSLENVVDISMAGGYLEYLQADGTWKKHKADGSDELYGIYPELASIYADQFNSVGITNSGKVIVVRSGSFDTSKMSAWKNIVKVAGTNKHIVGLKSDGTVCAVGLERKDFFQGNISHWDHIADISVSYSLDGIATTYGIKEDGTIIVSGLFDEFDITSLNKAEAAQEGIKGIIAHIDSGVDVRYKPGRDYYQVTKIPAGTKVFILETRQVAEKEWGRTIYGWIMMDYFEPD